MAPKLRSPMSWSGSTANGGFTSGAPYRVEWYPKVEHGFVFPLRACYHKASSERHWVRLHDLFERRLKKGAA